MLEKRGNERNGEEQNTGNTIMWRNRKVRSGECVAHPPQKKNQQTGLFWAKRRRYAEIFSGKCEIEENLRKLRKRGESVKKNRKNARKMPSPKTQFTNENFVRLVAATKSAMVESKVF